jgi:hypothetical protein
LAGNRIDCGVVLTAEFFPVCGKSTRTRCLRLKLYNPVPNALIQPFQERSELLGNVFAEFLRRTARIYPEIVDSVAEDFWGYRNQRAAEDAPVIRSERLAEIGFSLCETLDVVLKVFPRDTADEVMSGFQGRVNKWINWQLSPEAAPELRDLVAVIPDLHNRYPGYFKNHHRCWCITPDTLCELLRQRFKDPTLPRETVITLLRERGAIQMDKSKAATKKIKGVRYLWLIPNRLC